MRLRALGLLVTCTVGGCGIAVTGALDGGDHAAPGSSEGGPLVPDAAGDAPALPADDSGVDAADADASADGAPDADGGCPPPATVDAGVLAVHPLGTVTIDGTLTEWGCVPFTLVDKATAPRIAGSNPSGATLSAELALGYDAQYLYFAARITDTITGTSTAEPYLNDAVEIYLDGDATLAGTYGASDHQYVIDHKLFIKDYGPATPAVPAAAVLTAAVQKSAGGWVLEARVAWSALGGSVTAGRRVGFDVGFTNGSGTTQEQMLYWWYGPGTGAGVCTGGEWCCGAGSDPWCDTRRFGFAELRP